MSKAAEEKNKELVLEAFDTLFNLKAGIIGLGNDIEVRPKKLYVAFRRNQAFASVIFLRSKLKVYLNIQINEIDDHLKKARDVKGYRTLFKWKNGNNYCR
jgi:predicted transport protein